ncbi:uncharacterized protein N7483_005726 [Penicillium malachiteum]|uniref:uncharacterized protein n=1 Tax=Penicillium malachiteum TaxID=1324776 RepID=UPI002548CE02|nr:uncharacterized protein N7483_005726 [Penicillium malachiteum]KAJ5731218.1 hypothetical protein N7483_005726 [Penicillium malachiteum]
MTTSMGPSTFGVVHPPACLLCGIDVLNRIDLGIVTNLRALLKQDRWKLDTGKHILVPATEIEDKEFIRNPILSSCYFRAVVKLPSSRKLHLTGIGSQAMSRQPVTSGREQPFLYYLPRDVSTARVCGHIRPTLTFNNATPKSTLLDTSFTITVGRYSVIS